VDGHREAHGLVADEIVEVKEGSWALAGSCANDQGRGC
jgi:hypothetical protein